ncbi:MULTISPECIES: hypothetical protein [unclassified Streptomyces]|uniref:hypothetical protein n=1 Tax=unclassified Streptomyces TaxID=2593676 RepID=UPI00278BF6D2|nr:MULTISPECIES: hypothetical protein [unclassified Streptomyces]
MNVTFQIPPFFQEIVPGLDPAQARTHAAARAGDRAGTVLTEAQLDSMAAEYARASATLSAANVFYAATCLVTIDDDLSSGTLLIARHPLAHRDPETAVIGIGEVMAREHGSDAVRIWDLPCGRAVLVFEQSASLHIPAELTTNGEDLPVEVAEIQAYVPVPRDAVPGAQDMIVLTFSTPSTDHWEEYCEVVAAVLRSLTFTPGEAVPQETVMA